MNFELIIATFESVAALLGLGLLGFWVISRKILPSDALSLLSPLALDIALPSLVFVNIIMNAAEAMKGEGTLTITTRIGSDGNVEIRFLDTGPGIADDVLEHLFDPFFTTKEVGQGTGLGLSISHGIVERHGGTLTVTSRVGECTTFIVSLPFFEGGS